MRSIEQINEAASRLQAIIETAIDGIITINERGTVDHINPAAATLFGYLPEEVVGNNVKMLMPSPYHEEHDGYISRYHHTGKPYIIGIGREVEGRKKNGVIFPIRLAVSEMWINDKRMYTGIIHDLTDVKTAEAKVLELNRQLEFKVAERTEELARAIDRLLGINRKLETEIGERETAENALRVREQELQQALEKEKELNALKSRFVSMASHEFRTPLSTILSSVELVEMYQREDQQERRSRHIDRIKTAVGNLTDILNDFLSLSRLEEGRVESQVECIPLEAFIKATVEEVEHLLKTGQKLHYQGDNTDCEVSIDKRFLKNIFLNLLSNASKYSTEGQTIRCFCQVADTELIIEVTDEGIGIPEEDQKHLFTRFFRAHNVENIKGTGLGLHIVRRYVELLNGQISFVSELGKGSSFTVTVPITIVK